MAKRQPKTISFLQEKGGAGKTTQATNVARGLILAGFKTLLVDSDPMGSARDWGVAGEGKLVPIIGLDRETLSTDIKAVSSGYDFVVIDGAPQMSKLTASAIRASDLVLIPVQPSPYDVWATLGLVELIQARRMVCDGPDAAFVISRVIKNTKLSKEVAESLAEYDLPVFKGYTSQAIAYPGTASLGWSVFEGECGRAKSEIVAIINEILKRVGWEDRICLGPNEKIQRQDTLSIQT